jgi:hypothetical protein
LYVDCNIENGKLKLKKGKNRFILRIMPYERGVQSESQEGACESLKDPISLAIDVLF